MDLTKQLQEYQRNWEGTHGALVQEIAALVHKFEVTLDNEKFSQEEGKRRLKDSFRVKPPFLPLTARVLMKHQEHKLRRWLTVILHNPPFLKEVPTKFCIVCAYFVSLVFVPLRSLKALGKA
jgi:hypothetical protein